MKTSAIAPYLQASDDAFVLHPWSGDDEGGLSDRLDHWDPNTDLILTRGVEVDLELVRDDCQLGGDATFLLCCSWYSDRTRTRGRGSEIAVSSSGSWLITITVPGMQSGGRVTLETSLLLANAGSAAGVVSPQRSGSRLWSVDEHVRLEGSASRFPISVVSFEQEPMLPAGSKWFLEWDPDDLESPIGTGLRLMINSDDEALVRAVVSGSHLESAEAWRQLLRFDVTRKLIVGALRNEAFVASPDSFPTDSVGSHISQLVANTFPGLTASAAASHLRDSPETFEAEIQRSWLRVT